MTGRGTPRPPACIEDFTPAYSDASTKSRVAFPFRQREKKKVVDKERNRESLASHQPTQNTTVAADFATEKSQHEIVNDFAAKLILVADGLVIGGGFHE